MMTVLAIAWIILVTVGLAFFALGSSLYTIPEFDWMYWLGSMCIMTAMVVGVLMIFA